MTRLAVTEGRPTDRFAPLLTLLLLAAGCDGGSSRSPTGPTSAAAALSSCDLAYPPAEGSPYALPFPPGTEYPMIQGACPPNPAWGHHGSYAWDFEMEIGTPVVAARGGLVYFVVESIEDGDPSQPNGIGIEHADGTVAQYYHFTKDGVLVEPGDTVTQGQTIGLSGNTGPSTGPHLHLWVLRSRSMAGKADSLPISFSNAGGPLGSDGGLVQGATYRAL